MSYLSLVMIVKNEEDKIARCLKSVMGLVDEVVIVDTGSTDKTKDICLEYGAKVYDYKWCNDFSAARNFALDKSSGEWNLILDADEYITDFEVESLRYFIKSNKKRIGLVKIINLFEQDGEIRKSSSRISRLIPKGVRYIGTIHEQVDSSYPRENVEISLEHDGYLVPLKFDRNIEILLDELQKNNNDPYTIYQIAKTYYNNKMYKDASNYFDSYYKSKNFSADAFYNSAIVMYIYNNMHLKKFDLGLEVILDNFELLQEEADFHFACGIFFMEAMLNDPNKYSEYYNNIEISYLNALEVGDSENGVCGVGTYYAAYNLGVYYEINRQIEKAITYYSLSAEYDYSLAKNRLDSLSNIK